MKVFFFTLLLFNDLRIKTKDGFLRRMRVLQCYYIYIESTSDDVPKTTWLQLEDNLSTAIVTTCAAAPSLSASWVVWTTTIMSLSYPLRIKLTHKLLGMWKRCTEGRKDLDCHWTVFPSYRLMFTNPLVLLHFMHLFPRKFCCSCILPEIFAPCALYVALCLSLLFIGLE